VNEEGEDPFEVACREAEMLLGNHFVLNATLIEYGSYFRWLQQLIGGRVVGHDGSGEI
jgi:hypothetical protein